MAAFTPSKIKQMFPLVAQTGEQLKLVLSEVVASENGEAEISDIAQRFIADIIGNCVFGLDCNSLRSTSADFCIMGKMSLVTRRHNGLLRLLIEAFPNVARKFRFRYYHPECCNFFSSVVRETVIYREANNIKRPDIMDTLIGFKNSSLNAEKDAWDNANLATHATSFFVAGFESASGDLTFALYELAKNQAIQDKLRTEINEMFEHNNNELTYDGLFEMQYLSQVLSETFRKYPTIPYLFRNSQKLYPTADPKYYIEKNCWVFIPIYSIHHDPDLYPEPEKFDPDRFAPDEVKKRHSCAFIPFGQGPRVCIGERFGKIQLYIALSVLIRNFRFRCCDRTVPHIKLIQSSTSLRGDSKIFLKVEAL